MKSSPFKVNYGRELIIDFDIKKKRKHVKEIKDRHEKAKAALVKL